MAAPSQRTRSKSVRDDRFYMVDDDWKKQPAPPPKPSAPEAVKAAQNGPQLPKPRASSAGRTRSQSMFSAELLTAVQAKEKDRLRSEQGALSHAQRHHDSTAIVKWATPDVFTFGEIWVAGGRRGRDDEPAGPEYGVSSCCAQLGIRSKFIGYLPLGYNADPILRNANMNCVDVSDIKFLSHPACRLGVWNSALQSDGVTVKEYIIHGNRTPLNIASDLNYDSFIGNSGKIFYTSTALGLTGERALQNWELALETAAANEMDVVIDVRGALPAPEKNSGEVLINTIRSAISVCKDKLKLLLCTSLEELCRVALALEIAEAATVCIDTAQSGDLIALAGKVLRMLSLPALAVRVEQPVKMGLAVRDRIHWSFSVDSSGRVLSTRGEPLRNRPRRFVGSADAWVAGVIDGLLEEKLAADSCPKLSISSLQRGSLAVVFWQENENSRLTNTALSDAEAELFGKGAAMPIIVGRTKLLKAQMALLQQKPLIAALVQSLTQREPIGCIVTIKSGISKYIPLVGLTSRSVFLQFSGTTAAAVEDDERNLKELPKSPKQLICFYNISTSQHFDVVRSRGSVVAVPVSKLGLVQKPHSCEVIPICSSLEDVKLASTGGHDICILQSSLLSLPALLNTVSVIYGGMTVIVHVNGCISKKFFEEVIQNISVIGFLGTWLVTKNSPNMNTLPQTVSDLKELKNHLQTARKI